MSTSWLHNICHCGDCSTCLGAFCCSPCLYGRTSWRLRNYPMNPHSSPSFSWLNTDCVLMCCAMNFGLSFIPVWMQRREFRDRFAIKGNGCTDCLASCCCGCCAQAQHEVEVRERAHNDQVRDDLQQYQAVPQTGMVYEPQQQQPPPPPEYEQYGKAQNF